MDKTIHEEFLFHVKVIRRCSKLCGSEVVDSNYRMNINTYVVIALICLYFLNTFYTVYVTVVVEGEWTVFLHIICMAGSGLQGASKLFSCIAYRQNLSYLMNELVLIYEYYEKKHDVYKNVLRKSIKLFTKVNKSIGALYVILCVTLLLTPFYLRIFHNRKEFVMQFLVPGIDPNSEKGYLMLNGLHIICLLLGVFGNFAGDMYFITFTTHMPLIKDILRCKFEDLNEVVQNPRTNNGEKSMELLKDIFEWHQKYLRFIDLIKTAYFWVILVEIVSISVSIGCTLCSLLLGKWPIGIMYLIYCFIMLYIYCGLGTLVDIANDGFIYSCYNDSLWYKYSVREQKMLQIMLRMSQNTTGLTVGAVYPLSINNGLRVTKTVYTFTMMLINFIH